MAPNQRLLLAPRRHPGMKPYWRHPRVTALAQDAEIGPSPCARFEATIETRRASAPGWFPAIHLHTHLSRGTRARRREPLRIPFRRHGVSLKPGFAFSEDRA